MTKQINLPHLRSIGEKATDGPCEIVTEIDAISIKNKNGETITCDTAYYPSSLSFEDMEFFVEARNNWSTMVDALEEVQGFAVNLKHLMEVCFENLPSKDVGDRLAILHNIGVLEHWLSQFEVEE